VLHERTNGAFDAFYIKWSRRLRPPQALGQPQFIDTPAIGAAVEELNKDGCSILARRLPEADIAEITQFAFSTPALGVDPTERIAIRPEAIPRNTARHVWPVQEIIAVPAIQKLMLDPAFHQIAQDYLQATPLLTSVTLWIDAPADKKYGAHHYDNDGPGFLKFFFYLTDVEEDTGAHCFIKGTHGHRKPEPFKISRIYEDEKGLLAFYGKDNEVMFAAPRGTIIAEDTAGFHRGSTVLRKHRLLMQFQYSVMDIPYDDELHGRFQPVTVANIPAALRPVLSKLFRTA
jgi:hypothetical protein